jgi:hypothetical protein
VQNGYLVEIYDRHFTQQEIKDITKFYESAAGKKILAATPAIQQESMQTLRAIHVKLQAKIQELIEAGAGAALGTAAGGIGASAAAGLTTWISSWFRQINSTLLITIHDKCLFKKIFDNSWGTVNRCSSR